MSKTSQPKRETERSVEHDHDACIQTALSRAEKRCAEEGERFTGLRRQVLELVWAEHKPDTVKFLSCRHGALQGAPQAFSYYWALCKEPKGFVGHFFR